MDHAGALRSLPSLTVCPCFDLHRSGGDECLKIQQTESRFYQTVYARFLQTQLLQEHLTVLIALQLGNLTLGLGGNDQQLCVLVLDGLTHLVYIGVACLYAALVNVADIQNGLGSEQEQVMCYFLLIL